MRGHLRIIWRFYGASHLQWLWWCPGLQVFLGSTTDLVEWKRRLGLILAIFLLTKLGTRLKIQHRSALLIDQHKHRIESAVLAKRWKERAVKGNLWDEEERYGFKLRRSKKAICCLLLAYQDNVHPRSKVVKWLSQNHTIQDSLRILARRNPASVARQRLFASTQMPECLLTRRGRLSCKCEWGQYKEITHHTYTLSPSSLYVGADCVPWL